MIAPDLVPFLESGVSILVGSRDDGFFPDCVRGLGARVEADGAELTVFLAEATSAATLANLGANGRLAVCFSRAQDHRSIQVKGRVVSMAAGDARDRAAVERYRCELAGSWGFVGVPVRVTARVNHWPVRAVRFRVESIYLQTPGPGAGAPLRPAAAGGRAP